MLLWHTNSYGNRELFLLLEAICPSYVHTFWLHIWCISQAVLQFDAIHHPIADPTLLLQEIPLSTRGQSAVLET